MSFGSKVWDEAINRMNASVERANKFSDDRARKKATFEDASMAASIPASRYEQQLAQQQAQMMADAREREQYALQQSRAAETANAGIPMLSQYPLADRGENALAGMMGARGRSPLGMFRGGFNQNQLAQILWGGQ